MEPMQTDEDWDMLPEDVTFDFEKVLDETYKFDDKARGVIGEKHIVCKHWLRGLCKKGDFCEFLHEYDLSKMPECYFFSKFGECSNPECIYRHVPPEDKMKECPWYARGFCRHGPKCRHKHVKKVACENYLEGFCPFGPDCAYGHPKYEFPKDEDNPSKKPRTPMVCHKCGQIGHKAASCTVVVKRDTDGQPKRENPNLRPLDEVTCFKCGQRGHYANKCTNKRVQPPPGGYQIPSRGGGGGGFGAEYAVPQGGPGVGREFPPPGGGVVFMPPQGMHPPFAMQQPRGY